MGELTPDFVDQAADPIAASAPRAERMILDRLAHMVEARAIAPVLDRFFSQ
jgi:hypothetical protein